MPYSSLQTYVRTILASVPWEHWIGIGILSLGLTVFLIVRKKASFYGAICLGITTFVGLLLLETAVVIRYCGIFSHTSGVDLQVNPDRLFLGSRRVRIESFSNIAVFVPFGFFLAEFLASTKRLSSESWLIFGTLAAFGLSLCIEIFQLVLNVGFFELTDLVMNSFGGFLGASLSIVGRKVIGSRFRAKPGMTEHSTENNDNT